MNLATKPSLPFFIILSLFLLTASIGLSVPAAVADDEPDRPTTLHAAERGAPWVSFSDGTDLQTTYTGSEALVATMKAGLAEPLALATGDFDEDGLPDLVSGFISPSGGLFTLHRGNVDAIYPYSPPAHQQDRKSVV